MTTTLEQRTLRVSAMIAAAACLTMGLGTPGANSATDTVTGTTYDVSSGAVVQHGNAKDTPANPFIDRDGTFYFQQSVAQYAKTGPQTWDFYSGTHFDDATRSSISDAVNPSDSTDKNNVTT
ncbi:hypothetical protein GCM10023063_21080 [Arthrobacter methylotrophus]|uniref:Uncharacterized protein n=1 Tax=Arthrobacter methylotrophus TaxID=121291 RepID=A0ABV5UW33_9MICC